MKENITEYNKPSCCTLFRIMKILHYIYTIPMPLASRPSDTSKSILMLKYCTHPALQCDSCNVHFILINDSAAHSHFLSLHTAHIIEPRPVSLLRSSPVPLRRLLLLLREPVEPVGDACLCEGCTDFICLCIYCYLGKKACRYTYYY